MKRYYVFAFKHFYPMGGMDDCVGKYDEWNEAVEALKEHQSNDNSYIFDNEEERFICLDELTPKPPVSEDNIEF